MKKKDPLEPHLKCMCRGWGAVRGVFKVRL